MKQNQERGFGETNEVEFQLGSALMITPYVDIQPVTK